VPWPVAAGLAVLVVAGCMLPDLDHPDKKGARAFLVRAVAWWVYLATRTGADRVHDERVARYHNRPVDAHRKTTHVIETQVVMAGLALAVVAPIPKLNAWEWWIALAVFTSGVTHILADSTTESGAPISLIYNWVTGDQRWRHHHLLPKALRFNTDEGTDKILVVPVLRVGAVVLGLAMLGWIVPMYHALTGM
jgi:membrane-bound metal-dependent hydrolase YbcI (DUF457 family)